MISVCHIFTLSDRFDDPNNYHVNRELVTNVLVVGDQSYDITLIKHKEQWILLYLYIISSLLQK